MIAALILVAVFAFVAMIAFFAVFGALFGAAFGLLFKALPLLLVGWVVVKLIQAAEGRGGSGGTGLTTADRQWLDTRS